MTPSPSALQAGFLRYGPIDCSPSFIEKTCKKKKDWEKERERGRDERNERDHSGDSEEFKNFKIQKKVKYEKNRITVEGSEALI